MQFTSSVLGGRRGGGTPKCEKILGLRAMKSINWNTKYKPYISQEHYTEKTVKPC
jgi:hypothetical protein